MDSGLRDYFNIEQQVLDPEKAVNWAIGFDYTPTGNFLTGLNIQATYYIIKINGVLRAFTNPTNGAFQRPRLRLFLCDPGRLAGSGHRRATLCGAECDAVALCAIPGDGEASRSPIR